MLWNKPARQYLDGQFFIPAVPPSWLNVLAALEELGNPGWNWESFDKYSLKSERYVAVQKRRDATLSEGADSFTPPAHDTDFFTYDPAHRGTTGMVTQRLLLAVAELSCRASPHVLSLGVQRARAACREGTCCSYLPAQKQPY